MILFLCPHSMCVCCLFTFLLKKKKKETLDLIWIKKKNINPNQDYSKHSPWPVRHLHFFLLSFFLFFFFFFFPSNQIECFNFESFLWHIEQLCFFFFGKLLMHIEQVWVLGLLALLLCFLKFQIYCHLDSWMIGSNLCYVFYFIQVSA